VLIEPMCSAGEAARLDNLRGVRGPGSNGPGASHEELEELEESRTTRLLVTNLGSRIPKSAGASESGASSESSAKSQSTSPDGSRDSGRVAFPWTEDIFCKWDA
jgi:hypothetical protein